MIDLSKGPVHISSGPSSNPNSMCLTLISKTLENGGKVIWMARRLTDSRKLSDILGHLRGVDMDRMIVIEFDDKLEENSQNIKKIIPSLKKKDLLIVEDWCANYGRVKSKDVNLMKELTEINKDIQIVITSSSYEDASGEKKGLDGWMARGEKLLKSRYRTVWMTKIQDQFQKVIITDGEEQKIVNLTQNGFRNN
jgi:hypothetical protein